MIQNKKHQKGLVPARSVALARRTDDPEESPLFISALKSSLWGLSASAICGILLMTATTAIAYANPDPTALVASMGLLSLLPSAFAGGFVTAKKAKDAPLLCGILSGGMLTIATVILGLILSALPSSGYKLWQSLALHGASVAFSTLGALAGNVKRRPKPGKRRFG